MFKIFNYYRIANWLYRHNIPVLPKLIDYMIRLIFSCWLPHSVKIGRNLVLGYGGLGVVIHSDAVIGHDVHIDQEVTIGGNGTQLGVPVMGNDIYIGAGAKILGPISIGTGSIIGANAVVTKDIPARSLAVGVPAKVIRENIDIHSVLYHKKENSVL
ncbi:hypothetical protein A9Q89_04760 [Gammaproteobacteria bacterium 53_120_T64]|nr:hypothetical protein A9Q89_04760 [Gammaproteobacteria bacterium 53_120_T64]